jgi:hypothetical protein
VGHLFGTLLLRRAKMFRVRELLPASPFAVVRYQMAAYAKSNRVNRCELFVVCCP